MSEMSGYAPLHDAWRSLENLDFFRATVEALPNTQTPYAMALTKLLEDFREKCAETAENNRGERAVDPIRSIELDVAVRQFIEKHGEPS